MTKFLLALPFLSATVHADCWTLNYRRGEVRVFDGLQHYACYGTDGHDYACYSTAFFAVNEEVGRLQVKEDGTSTFLLSEVLISNSIWDDTVRFERRPVKCEPFSISKCASHLLATLTR